MNIHMGTCLPTKMTKKFSKGKRIGIKELIKKQRAFMPIGMELLG